MIHPETTLPSVDIEAIADSSSFSSTAPKPTPKVSSHSKRAIYDMDGSYSDFFVPEAEASNVYSAQDFSASASASAFASEAYAPHVASVKAVLKARRGEASASASSAWASASVSAASASISAVSNKIYSKSIQKLTFRYFFLFQLKNQAPEMWEQNMMKKVRRSVEPEVAEASLENAFDFDIGDIIASHIKSEIGKSIISAIKNIPKTSIDFDALRSSLAEIFSATSEGTDESSSSASDSVARSSSSAAHSSSTPHLLPF